MARVPGERQRREAQREGTAPAPPLEQPQRGPEDARARDGGDERHEPRKKEQEGARAATGGERGRIRGAARECECDRRESSERSDVGGRDRDPAHAHGLHAQRRDENERRDDGEPDPERDSTGRERRVAEDRADRDVQASRDECGHDGADRPAADRRGEGDRAGLRGREEHEWPAARSEPGQPPPRRIDVPPHARSRKDREREQERRGLAADQEEPTAAHPALLARRLELLDRRRQVEEIAARAELRPRARDVAREGVDRPSGRTSAGRTGSTQT